MANISNYKVYPVEIQKDLWEILEGAHAMHGGQLHLDLKQTIMEQGAAAAVEFMKVNRPAGVNENDEPPHFLECLYNACLYYKSTLQN